ncbi:hypothetical protein [Streptomyces fractus]|uniref:hypothetical protein n=1 Tax=Streptomyces fractus TaxID=641806 RepID=UPI003CF40601
MGAAAVGSSAADVVVSSGGVASAFFASGDAREKSVSGGAASVVPVVSMSTCTRWASTHARALSSGLWSTIGGSPSAASSSKFRFSDGAEKRRVAPLSRSPLPRLSFSGPRSP